MSYNKKKNNYILLSFVAAGIIPLLIELVKSSAHLASYDWFSANDTEYDFFLVCKMIGMMLTAAVMAAVIIWHFLSRSAVYKSMLDENRLVFLPMVVYILFAFLSAVLGNNMLFSFLGGYAQHEPFTVLIGYVVCTLFAYMFIKEETDIVRFLRLFMWGVAVISFTGVLQFLSVDFFNSDAGKSLITMFSDVNASQISLSFGEGRVYMTLYNPNYVGSYTALVIPVMAAGIFVMEKMWEKIVMGVVMLMLAICLIGSASTTGMSAIALSVLLIVVLFIPRFKSYGRYIGMVLGGAVLIIAFICIVSSDRISEAIEKYTLTDDVRLITAITPGDDEVTVRYKDTDMYVTSNETETGGLLVNVFDSSHNPVQYDYNADTGLIMTADEFYKDIYFSVIALEDGTYGFNINCGAVFTFVRDHGDGKYYFYNAYGKRTRDMVHADSFGFEGHESFASNRGFIWSRSIPLLADNIIYGCGPDNFVSEFPNNDYVSMYNNTYSGQVVTRPHNMYLQIGVQTGVISLIAYIIMYVVYFVQSVRLLWKSKNIGRAYILSMALLVGSFGYMVCGLANDSTLGVAPVFWTFIGLGLSCNRLLRASHES